MVTISDAPTQLLLKVQNIYVLIHAIQEEPKMAVSVSKWHNAGNCKTDLADLPFFNKIFLFSAYYNEFAMLVCLQVPPASILCEQTNHFIVLAVFCVIVMREVVCHYYNTTGTARSGCCT